MIKYFLILLFSFIFVIPVYAGTGLNVSEGYINFNGVNGGLSVDSFPIFIASTTYDSYFIGLNQANSSFTGSLNYAFGANSLSSLTYGYSNYAFGSYNLASTTSGSDNFAFGTQALRYNTTGYDNVALGSYSLQKLDTGYGNVAIGTQSLLSASSGNRNVSIGALSSLGLTTGSGNVAIGRQVFGSNITGSSNVAIGFYTNRYNQSATNTVMIGTQAGSGSSNYYNQGGVYLGYRAGYSNASGSDYNTFLGYQAGYSLITGKANVIIGQNVNATSTSSTGGLNIGNAIFGSGLYTGTSVSNTAMTNVKIGIGTSSPSEALSVSGKVLADAYLEYSPIYVGDALSSVKSFRAEVSSVKSGSNWASVDHAFLPEGVRYEKQIYVPPVYATTTLIIKGEEGLADEVVVVEDRKKVLKEGFYYTFVGRDLGKQVQFNVRAIQQLLERIEVLEAKLNSK